MSNHLTDRQENVISLLYGLDDGRERTYKEVGRIFGITSERVRQIKLKAIKKIGVYIYL